MNRRGFGKRPGTSRAIVEDDEPKRRRCDWLGLALVVVMLVLLVGWLVLG